ncbi:MAG: hypothetical protein E2591_03980 [Achromobacter sp.]|uniref:hypothetical protein n=1 Tax=Achromobacter sp. TaxID=134375 RepID=UPI0012CB6D5F|nr:hypothetical protein [Achromobacter sp.]
MKIMYGLYLAISLLVILGAWNVKQDAESSAMCEVMVDGKQARSMGAALVGEERAAEIKKCKEEKAWK